MTIKNEDVPEHLLWVVSDKLSDGSEVFNVEFEGTKFPAIDRDRAIAMAEAIADAINENTNSTADVMYEA